MEETKRVVAIQIGEPVGGMVVDVHNRIAILAEVEYFLDEMSPGEYISLTIMEMSDAELSALPEFTGW